MKAIKHMPLMIALTLLLGCTTTFRPWLLSDVKEGMDKSMIVKLLGEPDFTETKGEEELWHYSYSENYNPAPADVDIRSVDATRRLRDQEIKSSLKEYRYVVILVDGKVQSYKEIPQ